MAAYDSAAKGMATSISRRVFLKYAAVLASLLALPPGAAPRLAHALARAPRSPVVWLSFQACTGCVESLCRATAPALERLILDMLSLDYLHTLQAAAGSAAEAARAATLRAHSGHVLLVVDGSLPVALDGACSTSAGEANLSLLRRCLEAAEAVVALGSCAAFGGLAAAAPNPTGALSVAEVMRRGLAPSRPLLNLPGCPPLPEAIAGVLAYRVAYGDFPERDALGRPLAYYAETVHERCSRRGHFQAGRFAKRFDDAGARAGWCLLELGCKGPVTRNACATLRWNGVGNPMESGHPCLGCAEPGFWDRGGFYAPLPAEAVAAGEAPSGAAVYDSRCVYCHDADPGKLQTEPGRVADLLRAGRVRAHRFSLEDAEMRALVDYLKENR